MKLRFLGATRTVTGSFFVIETSSKRFAIDCGLFQGVKEVKERNYTEFVVDPQSIDFVILTHAHIDHTGLIPKLCKHGFKGDIYCSHPTNELVKVLLPDSGYIQEMEVERKNRKLLRAGKLLMEPIYTSQDAMNCLPQIKGLYMDEIIELAPEIKVRLRDAGHILGSCIVEIWVEENGKTIKLVFSGDLGNSNQPLVKDPTVIENADYLILESTYGNRLHKGTFNRQEQLESVIKYTMEKGGNLIIPAFAVERTQDLLYDLNTLYQEGRLDPKIDIFIDSPLAIAATKIFADHIEYFDSETRDLIRRGQFSLPNLKFSNTQEESQMLNERKSNTIIISASGMCDAGRIKYHLKYNLWRPESTILFVGYQAFGTLGRRIVDGEKLVQIHGEQIAVKADIRSIEAYSAHADRAGLINWLKHFTSLPKAIFLVHGEPEAQEALSDLIRQDIRIPVYIPDWMDEFDLYPIDNIESKTEVVVDDLSKAMLAEQLYLELRSEMHYMFKKAMDSSNYDAIIDSMKKIKSAID